MATFCLIHGSAHSPRGWDLLASEMRRRGHEVLIADLPAGVNEFPWKAYRDAIEGALDKAKNVILVGTLDVGYFSPGSGRI